MFESTFYFLCAGFCLLFYLFYRWATQNNDYFEKNGVKALKPMLFFGNTFQFFLKKIELIDFAKKLYDDFPDQKIFGLFNFMRPIYLIRDPEFFKKITIKDFDSFEDHKFFVEPEMDSLLGSIVSLMCGNRWRKMRSTLSPLFTSSKMRQMFELVQECWMDSRDYLFENYLPTADSECEMEMQDFFRRVANDILASCAFGLKINSQTDRTNEFFEIGLKLGYLGDLRHFLKMLFMRAFPWLASRLHIEYLDSDMHKMFNEIVMHKIETRQKSKIYRPDLIDLIVRVKQKESENSDNTKAECVDEMDWSDKELVAQALVFLIAGFDTSMWAMVATAYQLALNPDIQQRLFDEIDAVTKSLDVREISYDDLNKIKFFDMVLSEVLRLHAPGVLLDRLCTKNYLLTDGDKVNVMLKKGDQVWVPIHCFHLDAKYFPNPEVFDPERFNDENKANINPGFYAPFGIGPRACIGTRFALMELKTVIFYLLKDFSLHVSSKTEIPMQVKGSLFGLNTKNGLNIMLRRRQ